MKETNEQARLRLFLQEYERLCKRYSLIVLFDQLPHPHEQVCERYAELDGEDYLPEHIKILKGGGIEK